MKSNSQSKQIQIRQQTNFQATVNYMTTMILGLVGHKVGLFGELRPIAPRSFL